MAGQRRPQPAEGGARVQVSDADLAVIVAALRAANSVIEEEVTPFSRTRSWRGSWPGQGSAGEAGLDGILQHHLGAGMADVFDLMHRQMQDMLGAQDWPGAGPQDGPLLPGQADPARLPCARALVHS